MKLFLDTHIWVWSLGDPSRLARRVALALGSKDSELWLSPISLARSARTTVCVTGASLIGATRSASSIHASMPPGQFDPPLLDQNRKLPLWTCNW